jgi:hypothetical protein
MTDEKIAWLISWMVRTETRAGREPAPKITPCSQTLDSTFWIWPKTGPRS